MALELHHRFAGEAARRPQQQQQGLIHPLLGLGIDHMAVEHPMAIPELLAGGCEQLAPDRFRLRPGNPHNGHTSLARGDRGGDGGDCVEAGIGHRKGSGADHLPFQRAEPFRISRAMPGQP